MLLVNLTQRISTMLLSLLLMTLSACAIAMQSPVISFSEGDNLFQQGNIADALLIWQKLPINSEQQHFEFALRQARAYRELNNAKESLQNAIQAKQYAELLAQTQQQILADIELGLAQSLNRQFDEARHTLINVQKRLINNQYLEQAKIENGLALLDILNRQNETALQHYNNAQKQAELSGDKLLMANTAVLQTQLTAEINKTAAQLLWKEALNKVQNLTNSSRRNFALIHLARIAQTNALFTDETLAMQLLKDAQLASELLNDDRLLSYTLGYQGSYYERKGQFQLATQLTNLAADAAQRSNSLESLYLWEWQAARLHSLQQRNELALAAYRRAVFTLQQIRQYLATSQSFKQEISPLFLGLADSLLKKARISDNKTEKQSLLQEARNTVEQLKSAELQDYFQDRCVANFKEKSRGLETIADKTAVLYPIILPDRLEILLSFNDGLQQFSIAVNRELFNATVKDFRYKLEKRTTFQYLKPAAQLHDWLIVPLLSELKAHHIETLVIVPDGSLRTIPFAALYDGHQYLMQQFALAVTPSLELTNPQTLATEHIAVLLNGLTKSVQGFSHLPHVSAELKAIQAQFSDHYLLENEDFKNNRFSEALLNNPYRIIHIASHGQFNKNPKASFLLSYDGRITMDNLENYLNVSKYRNEPVELLTLSACQTATGDDRAALGMAGVAIKAGARSALASLWFINDKASSDLMTLFYTQLKQHHSKAQSLAIAQRTLLKDIRYRHASYWSPFLLIGNWL